MRERGLRGERQLAEAVEPVTRPGGLPRPVWVCSGCGWPAPGDRMPPFHCPRAREGDGVDHVLARRLVPDRREGTGGPSVAALFARAEPRPFLRYRELLGSWHLAGLTGLTDDGFLALADDLGRRVAEVDGRGFRVTPFAPAPRLAAALGVASVRVKDETGNVAGSHKARHLFGVALWLEVAGRAGQGPTAAAPLAIASCGNAALAAAVVARAAERRLAVFVPTWADPWIVGRLQELGARLTVCPRDPGAAGDPCVHGFRRAVEAGSLPFTCQGPENGLAIEGGQTLAWEMVSELATGGEGLDRVFVQVGGGALATAVHRGLEEAHCLGALARVPRFHAVQSAGAWPVVRAWRRLVERIFERHSPAPGAIPPGDAARAARLLDLLSPASLEAEIGDAARHRADFMHPWEQEPRSVATGILDDETYDWLAVVRAMVVTGGYPVVVSEDRLRAAHRLARETTGIPADPTGTAGLAGALELTGRGEIGARERLAVLLTGVERGGSESRTIR